MFNWIDVLILVVFALFVIEGFRRGFLRTAGELIGLIIAFIFALKFYPVLEPVLKFLHTSSDYAKSISFLIIWFVVQIIFLILGRFLSFYTPTKIKDSVVNHYFGLVPAACKGVVFVSVLLIIFMIIPALTGLKFTISHSLFGGYLVRQTAKIELQIETVFSGDANDGGLLTNDTQLEENSDLGFKTTDITIDADSESQMLAMLNLERAKAGLNPLAGDILIRNVSRAKSREMLIEGYFAHTAPNGENLLNRLNNADVSFVVAAENIALAPTIDLAEVGLMNSPKHKANILDPQFTKVGIGVIDAKEHGIMVTQIFIR